MNNIINTLMKQLKQNKWLHYTIIVLIGIALSIPLMKIQIRDTHDGCLHWLRVLGTLDTIKIGQIPPLINHNYCSGAGYAMNLFYPPLVTYIPLIIKLFTSTYSATLKIFGCLCIVLSGITSYQFAYQITKKRSIALFTAVFYLIAPYKLANVYKRFAIGEFAAAIFIPIVFTGIYNLFEEDGKKHYYIAIGAICLMISHTVTTLYTAIFCGLYILFNIKKLKEKIIIKKIAIDCIFILLVSMFFWFPLLEAKNKAQYTVFDDNILGTNGAYAYKNTLHLSQLFKDLGEENGTTFLIGLPTLFAILLTIYAIKKVDSKYKSFYLICIIFSLISIYMVSKFFPWIIMPNIVCKLQYPWRIVGFFNFFISLVCGINIYILLKQIARKDIIRIAISTLFIILSIASSIKICSQFWTKDDTLDEKYDEFISSDKKIPCTYINRDYMPLKAIIIKDTYVINRKDETYILQGNAKIIEENKNNLSDKIKIENAEAQTVLEFPYLYYPGYKIQLIKDNKEISIKPIESDNGYLSCILPENIENGEISLEYVRYIYYSFFLHYIFN